MNVELLMKVLCCDKTTEQGADEVYILVVGTRSDGAKYAARLPNDAPGAPQGHWDMNDGDQPTDNPHGDSHCVSQKSLFTGDLPLGQSWSLAIMMMELSG